MEPSPSRPVTYLTAQWDPMPFRLRNRLKTFAAVVLAATVVAGCDGPQSALDPSGPEARQLANLFWTMAIGAACVWLFIAIITVFVIGRARSHRERWGNGLIWGGGVILPVAVLSVLLPFAFGVMVDLRTEPGPAAMKVEITGHTWWWEVVYEAPGVSDRVVAANELRIPVDRPVEVTLRSQDVIHSFWVPAWGGKMDLIPGRTNRTVIEADEPGVFRGQCAEYCGAMHAWMAFAAVAMEPDAFDAWLTAQAAPYRPARTADPVDTNLPFRPGLASDPAEREGLVLFLDSGCGACHTIRGTSADGELGPDLTHVGSRLTIAAGLLPNNVGTLAGWIANAQGLKPGNEMPSFNTLSGRELRTLAQFLSELD